MGENHNTQHGNQADRERPRDKRIIGVQWVGATWQVALILESG
jgi:hypothetical protein